MFLNFECHAMSWKKLKKTLAEEFSSPSSSKEVHRQLSTVRNKSDDTYYEYIYQVHEIASHEEIELE